MERGERAIQMKPSNAIEDLKVLRVVMVKNQAMHRKTFSVHLCIGLAGVIRDRLRGDSDGLFIGSHCAIGRGIPTGSFCRHGTVVWRGVDAL